MKELIRRDKNHASGAIVKQRGRSGTLRNDGGDGSLRLVELHSRSSVNGSYGQLGDHVALADSFITEDVSPCNCG
jgi:hypothetical protein